MDFIIAGAVRLPLGNRGGAPKEVHLADLGAEVLRQTLISCGVEASSVQEVILGNVIEAGIGMNPSAPACDQGRHRPERSFPYHQSGLRLRSESRDTDPARHPCRRWGCCPGG